jgi:anti-sigma regulatory factor (Ser/Thr protein kinase)
VPGDQGEVLRLPTEAAQVRTARDFVRARVAAWGLPDELADDVIVVTSELITNAIKYAPSKAELALARDGDVIRVEVRDDEPAAPALAKEEDTGAIPGGRGLRIVTALAARWGVETEDDGKAVWAEFDTC